MANRLSEWLQQTRTQRSVFARELGTSPATVTRWCQGERAPSRYFARKIVAATNGAVTFADLYGEPSSETPA